MDQYPVHALLATKLRQWSFICHSPSLPVTHRTACTTPPPHLPGNQSLVTKRLETTALDDSTLSLWPFLLVPQLRPRAGASDTKHAPCTLNSWPTETTCWAVLCSVASVVFDYLRPCRLQPDSLLCLWDSQARILEWVAMPSSRGSSWPRDRTHISWASCRAGWFFTAEPSGKLTETMWEIQW